jgi:hypothetical protein
MNACFQFHERFSFWSVTIRRACAGHTELDTRNVCVARAMEMFRHDVFDPGCFSWLEFAKTN